MKIVKSLKLLQYLANKSCISEVLIRSLPCVLFHGQVAVSGHGQDPWHPERGNAHLCSLLYFSTLKPRVSSEHREHQHMQAEVEWLSKAETRNRFDLKVTSQMCWYWSYHPGVGTVREAVPGEGTWLSRAIGVPCALLMPLVRLWGCRRGAPVSWHCPGIWQCKQMLSCTQQREDYESDKAGHMG